MLLQWKSVKFLTEEDSLEFFNKYEMEIMGIFGQYAAMYPTIDEEECAMLTVLYLLYGKNEEPPDLKLQVPEDVETVVAENKFLCGLYELVCVASTLHQLRQKRIIDVQYNKDGQKCFKLSAEYLALKQKHPI